MKYETAERRFFCGKRIDFLIYDFRLSDFFPLANAS